MNKIHKQLTQWPLPDILHKGMVLQSVKRGTVIVIDKLMKKDIDYRLYCFKFIVCDRTVNKGVVYTAKRRFFSLCDYKLVASSLVEYQLRVQKCARRSLEELHNILSDVTMLNKA